MTEADKNEFWKSVREHLVQSFHLNEVDAIESSESLRKTIDDDIFYHADPIDIAQDIKDHWL